MALVGAQTFKIGCGSADDALNIQDQTGNFDLGVVGSPPVAWQGNSFWPEPALYFQGDSAVKILTNLEPGDVPGGDAGELAVFAYDDPTLIAVEFYVPPGSSIQPLMHWAGDGFNTCTVWIDFDDTLAVRETGDGWSTHVSSSTIPRGQVVELLIQHHPWPAGPYGGTDQTFTMIVNGGTPEQLTRSGDVFNTYSAWLDAQFNLDVYIGFMTELTYDANFNPIYLDYYFDGYIKKIELVRGQFFTFDSLAGDYTHVWAPCDTTQPLYGPGGFWENLVRTDEFNTKFSELYWGDNQGSLPAGVQEAEAYLDGLPTPIDPSDVADELEAALDSFFADGSLTAAAKSMRLNLWQERYGDGTTFFEPGSGDELTPMPNTGRLSGVLFALTYWSSAMQATYAVTGTYPDALEYLFAYRGGSSFERYFNAALNGAWQGGFVAVEHVTAEVYPVPGADTPEYVPYGEGSDERQAYLEAYGLAYLQTGLLAPGPAGGGR